MKPDISPATKTGHFNLLPTVLPIPAFSSVHGVSAIRLFAGPGPYGLFVSLPLQNEISL